jgi:hypothetical protein
LDDWKAQRGDFEFVGSFVEMLIRVDPGQKAGDVVELGEGYDRLVELDFAAGDELALEDSIVNLFVQGSLALGQT